MAEVKYSLNGKLFKDYGVFVSSSAGIGGVPKRKALKSYNWEEYNGNAVDLSSVKFESREIILNCFIRGNDWQTMIDNFNLLIRTELTKPGTQRLLIEPMSFKALPFEVFLEDEIKIEKDFKNGVIYGTFQLKLIEPNPIKKVLFLLGTSLNLSYNSTQETEIFYGNGTKDLVKTNASISGKTLPANSYIIIAGDIDGITNLTTNATVLWEKL